MPIYNLIEYNDNHCDTLGSLWQLKKDEIEGDVDWTVNNTHISNNSSPLSTKQALLHTEMVWK